MKFVDTHTHLYAEQFAGDRPEMIERAVAAGVEEFFLPNIDRHSIEGMLRLEQDYPGRMYPMMGLHPCSVGPDFERELEVVRQWLERRHFAAIGEIGMDLYWDTTYRAQQEQAFRVQVAWAKTFNLPIVIHSRETIDILIDLLRELQDGHVRGIFHCFTGTKYQAEAIIDLGFVLGIGGVLTFKKAGLDKVVSEIDMQHLVLETDAPYLAPVPHRGKRNESAYVVKVAERLAEVKGISLEKVAQVTTANAERVFEYNPVLRT